MWVKHLIFFVPVEKLLSWLSVFLASRHPCRNCASLQHGCIISLFYSVVTEVISYFLTFQTAPIQNTAWRSKSQHVCGWVHRGWGQVNRGSFWSLLERYIDVDVSFFQMVCLWLARRATVWALLFSKQVRRSAGLQTRNWTVSPAALIVCSLLNWHKHLWMQMETMCFRSV